MFEGGWLTRRLNRVMDALHSKSPAWVRRILEKLEAAPVVKRVMHGAFWSGLGAILGRFVNLLASILLARILGKVAFGEYGMVVSTLGMLGPMATLSLAPAASVFIAQNREKNPGRAGKVIHFTLWTTFVMGAVVGSGVFFGANYLSRTLHNEQLAGAIRLSGILMLSGALTGALTGILTGFEAFKRMAFIGLWSNLLSLPVTAAGAYFGGVRGLILAMILVQFFSAAAYYETVRKRAKASGIHPAQPGFLTEWRHILGFSLPTMAASMISGPANWISQATLVSQPAGYGENGIFQMALQWRIPVLLLPNMIANSSLPVMANSGQDPRQFARAVRTNVMTSLALASTAALGVALCSRLITAFYGKDFSSGAAVISVVAAAAVFSSLSDSLAQVILSRNKVWINFTTDFFWAVIMVLLSRLWIPGHLALGMACASLVSYVAVVIWQSAVVWRLLDQMKKRREP
jgi:O-antigen/teichoic acid export membrane protein